MQKNYEWLTPPEIISALGEFDLDPCAPVVRPWPMAKKHYTILDNGLIQPWEGRVWLNPPYGKFAEIWVDLLSKHGDGLALIPGRTGSPWFHRQIFEKAHSILFLEHRIWFYDITGKKASGNAGHDSVIVSFNEKNAAAISDSGLTGSHRVWNAVPVIVITISPSWKSVISMVLTKAGGKAQVQEIYEMVKFHAPDKVKKNRHFREKVRQMLQQHFVKIDRGIYSNTAA